MHPFAPFSSFDSFSDSWQDPALGAHYDSSKRNLKSFEASHPTDVNSLRSFLLVFECPRDRTVPAFDSTGTCVCIARNEQTPLFYGKSIASKFRVALYLCLRYGSIRARTSYKVPIGRRQIGGNRIEERFYSVKKVPRNFVPFSRTENHFSYSRESGTYEAHTYHLRGFDISRVLANSHSSDRKVITLGVSRFPFVREVSSEKKTKKKTKNGGKKTSIGVVRVTVNVTSDSFPDTKRVTGFG